MGLGIGELEEQSWLGPRSDVHRGGAGLELGLGDLNSEIQYIMANAYMEPPLWTD